jgi:transposase
MLQAEPTAGIDSGKHHLDVAIVPGLDRIRLENTAAGVAALVAWLRARGVRVVGIEASGGVERQARDALLEAGMTVRVFDPGRVRHYAKAKGRRAKSDPLDAALIAEFTAAFPEAPSAVRDPEREELAGLVRVRQLVVAKRADLVKGLASAPPAARALMRDAITGLKAAEAALEAAVAERVAANPGMARAAAALASAPGVGPVTAAMLTALLPELGHVTGARIAALVGVAPFDDDSGARHGRRRISGGRGDVRRALYMATLHVTCGRGVLGEFYRRLIDRGKPPKVALAACMRKLVVRLNAMLTAGTTWQERPA